jgi:hypothetical protein
VEHEIELINETARPGGARVESRNSYEVAGRKPNGYKWRQQTGGDGDDTHIQKGESKDRKRAVTRSTRLVGGKNKQTC